MTKHYIRPDQNGTIIHYFSSDFESPKQGDFCVNENGERQFHFDLLDENGFYKWDWDGTKKVPANLDFQLPRVKELKLAEFNRIAESEIIAAYPKHKQLNILMLGRDNTTGQAYTAENQVTMREFIDIIRTKLANKEAQVNNAATAAEVGGILW